MKRTLLILSVVLACYGARAQYLGETNVQTITNIIYIPYGTNHYTNGWWWTNAAYLSDTNQGLSTTDGGAVSLWAAWRAVNANMKLIWSGAFPWSVTATNFRLAATNVYWVDVPMNYAYSTVGANVPALDVAFTNSTVRELAFDEANDELFAQAQMPHNVAVTNTALTNLYIEPHVHWHTSVTPTAARSNVVWSMEWRMANIGGTFAWGDLRVTNGAAAEYTHYMTELGHVTNLNMGISAVFSCRLTHPATSQQDISTSTAAHEVFLDGLDLHVPVGNSEAGILGSRTDSVR